MLGVEGVKLVGPLTDRSVQTLSSSLSQVPYRELFREEDVTPNRPHTHVSSPTSLNRRETPLVPCEVFCGSKRENEPVSRVQIYLQRVLFPCNYIYPLFIRYRCCKCKVLVEPSFRSPRGSSTPPFTSTSVGISTRTRETEY